MMISTFCPAKCSATLAKSSWPCSGNRRRSLAMVMNHLRSVQGSQYLSRAHTVAAMGLSMGARQPCPMKSNSDRGHRRAMPVRSRECAPSVGKVLPFVFAAMKPPVDSLRWPNRESLCRLRPLGTPLGLLARMAHELKLPIIEPLQFAAKP